MKCQFCGTGELRAVETRTSDAGLMRIRRCTHCGVRLRTMEVPEQRLAPTRKYPGTRLQADADTRRLDGSGQPTGDSDAGADIFD